MAISDSPFVFRADTAMETCLFDDEPGYEPGRFSRRNAVNPSAVAQTPCFSRNL